ncbi:MAG: uroporphyrinogen-III synthase [Acidobacteriota bacterium]|nr:uroporphyrinogen-III synthase [Acidobacteriota bacterium]
MPNATNEKTYALVSSPLNKRLAGRIEMSGCKVIQFPPIETQKVAFDKKSGVLITEWLNFDWLIFFDVFAVDYFLQTLEENQMDFFELDEFRVCALGEAVADRLRFVQLHADVIPQSVETGAVFDALSAYIGEDMIMSKSFLLVKKRSPENEINIRLSEKGAIVAELEIYRASFTETGENVRLKTLLKGGAIDEFVFSSTEELIALKELLSPDLLAEVLFETDVSATDDVTFQSLKEYNLKPKYFYPK